MSNQNGYIGRSPGDSAVVIASQTFEPTGIQTDFTFASGYDPGYIDVYFNGARLVYANDYTATNGSTVGLTTYANNGDVLELVAYKAFNVGNVQEAAGNFSVGNKLTVVGATTATSAYYTGIVTATSFSGDGSSLTGLANTDVINTENINVIGVATVGSAVTINSTGIDAVSGIITAATFKGALTGNVTGNVTGNCSGSSGSATGTAGGLTGTPDITVRNITGVAATFTGVLTYEDVTNVDSVGVVTARGGFEIGAAGVGGTITAVGNAQFTGIVTATQFRGGSAKFTDDGADSPIVSILADNQTPKALVIGNSTYNASESFGQNFYTNNAGEGYFLHVADGSYQDYHFSLNDGSTNKVCLKFEADDQSVELYNSGSKKFETTIEGTITTGIATVTAIDGGISAWVLGANGTNHYTFTGPGNLSATDDPQIELQRGQTYVFRNRSGGHPFRIQSTVNGSTGTQYSTGVTNNDGGDGTDIIFDVPFDAPNILYYQCTSHANMGGVMLIGERGIPANTQTGAYVLVADDAGKTIYISTGGVTINDSLFSEGDAVTIINNSGSNQTITQGTGVTLYDTGDDGSTGNKTLKGRGMCTVWFASASVGYISGNFD